MSNDVDNDIVESQKFLPDELRVEVVFFLG